MKVFALSILAWRAVPAPARKTGTTSTNDTSKATAHGWLFRFARSATLENLTARNSRAA